MKPAVKWIAIGAGALVVLLLILGGTLYGWSSVRLGKSYQVSAASVFIPSDSSAIDYGRRLVHVRGCVDCHGEDLAGTVFFDEPPVARLSASNLTPGEGGIGASYSDEDWVRAIRHGVGPDGRGLLFMPSHEYNPMGDEDLGALIAYLKNLEPIDRDLPANRIGPVGRALYLAGEVPLVPAEIIDHSARRSAPPPPGVTAEYGAYLAVTCTGCHGAGLSGGRIPGTPPSYPLASNITPDVETGIGTWTQDDFRRALREGVAPGGRQLDPVMPWMATRHMTDDEISAIWLYIQSLPPVPFGNR